MRYSEINEDISNAQRRGMITKLRNAMKKGSIIHVEGELQLMDFYKPWPELDRIKDEFLSFTSTKLRQGWTDVINMLHWLHRLGIEWAELGTLVKKWADRNKKSILQDLEFYAKQPYPAYPDNLIKSLQRYGVDWPELKNMLSPNVGVYLKKLDKDITVLGGKHYHLHSVTATVLHLPQVTEWMGKNRDKVIRAILDLIKYQQYRSSVSIVDKLIDAGFNWPELAIMKKSLMTIKDPEDR